MVYFTQDYLDFFAELSENNHKDWFDENRKRYKTTVKEPLSRFVDKVIGAAVPVREFLLRAF